MTQPLPASQTQSNSVGNANVGGDFIFNPTQIIQISVAEVTRKALIKSSPYKGLDKFNYKDRDFFFGRDKQINELLIAVNRSSFSLVLGASGSGKSSLVRAGLIYELQKSINSQFCDLIFTPNDDPFESLYRCLLNEEKDYKFNASEVEIARTAKADTLVKVIRRLKKEGEFWLIFIDQFEEIFTRCNQDQANNFIEAIAQVALLGDRSLKIVLAMRSDFSHKLSFYPHLSEIANQHNTYIVPIMYAEKLREAIEQPAAKHGVVFEEGLVEQIIKDVDAENQEGYLPLLQYTLELLWKKECHTLGSDNRPHIEDRTLNKASYEVLEGVRGALQTQVDQIYKDICKKYQDGEIVTKQIFVKLVNIVGTDSENKIVSRRAYQNEFAGDSTIEILNIFINSKLLVSSCDDLTQSKDATVEIAHEILLSSWNTLKNWIEEEKEAIKLKNLLADEIKRWQKTRQENESLAEEELLKGYRLAEIVLFREKDNFKNIGGLSSEENEFIDVSIASRDRQRNREKRRNQIIRITAGVSAILALFAGHQWRRSELEQIRTLTKSSEALMLSNQTLNARIASLQAARKLEQSIWQAVAPKELHNQVLDGLVQTAYGGDYTIREYNRLESNNTPVVWSRDLISWNSNGDLAYAGGDNTVKLHKSDGTRKTLKDFPNPIFAVSWSVDNVLAIASGNTVTLWNRDGDLQGSFELPQDRGAYYGMRWSPNGQILAFPTQANTALLLRRDGQIIQPLGGHTIGVFALSWSNDGMLATASGDGSINLWRWDSEPIKLDGHSDWVIGVSWSRDGILASAGQDGTVKLWNRDGKLLQTLPHAADVTSVSWSPNGILAAASSDKRIHLWKPDGTRLTTLRSHGSVASLAWSSDGKLASESKDGTVQLWRPNPLLTSLIGHTDAVNSVSWSRDVVASGGDDSMVKLWQLDGTLYRTLGDNRGSVRSVSWSVDGTLAAASFDRVQLWTQANNYSQSQILDHSQHRSAVYQNLPTQVKSVSWSPDGQSLASATWGATVQWWNRNGNWQAMYEDSDWVEGVSWSSRVLAAAGKNGHIKIFNFDGTLRKEFPGLGQPVLGVSWSFDGQILASANPAYIVRLWDENGHLLDVEGHEDDVLSVSWHPTQQIFASASRDGVVKLWKRDGTPIMTLKGHANAVNEVNWSFDDKFLATASSDKTVKLWRLDVDLENDRQLFNTLLTYNCDWLRDYFKTNPDKIKSDRQFCSKISPH